MDGWQKGVLLISHGDVPLLLPPLDLPALLRFFKVVLNRVGAGTVCRRFCVWTQSMIRSSSRRASASTASSSRPEHHLIPCPVGARTGSTIAAVSPARLRALYDVIYVANLTPMKRVHVLLSALRSAARRGRTLAGCRRALELGQRPAGLRAAGRLLRRTLSDDGVEDLNQSQLNEWLNRARSFRPAVQKGRQQQDSVRVDVRRHAGAVVAKQYRREQRLHQRAHGPSGQRGGSSRTR